MKNTYKKTSVPGYILSVLLITAIIVVLPVSCLLSSEPGYGILYIDWTAPGDDAYIGTAYQYDLRYNTVPITEENFLQSTLIITPTPSIAGTTETVMIEFIAGSYFFGLKTSDEKMNWSELSNIPKLNVGVLPPILRWE